jgi:hypothetical protein
VHRSPLCMLVLGAALAACSTRDDPRSGELLSQDSTLVARLDVGHDVHQTPLPDTCRTIVANVTPAVVNKPKADTLARQASDAEILGNVQEASTLFRRASELDGTNKTTAYHLGRTSEALGDRSAAIGAYCRYLALSPTPSESAEARERVASLTKRETHAVTSGAGDRVAKPGSSRVATTRRARRRTPREPRAVEPRVAESRIGRANTTRTARAERTTVEQVGGPVDSTTSGGEVVATTPTREPSVDQPSSASRSSSRGPSRAQSAGIGAAAGAIIGAATGRSVKGAVIGAAAGGILGTAVGGGR